MLMLLKHLETRVGAGKSTRNTPVSAKRKASSTLFCQSTSIHSIYCSFHVATKEQSDLYPHTHDPAFRGNSGPIQVTAPHNVYTVDRLFQETLVKRGLKPILDPYGGDINGAWMAS